jgi:cadmium resistance protein CadD (predicted permease)
VPRSQEAGGSVNLLSLALLSTGVFASTNIDDLFVLVGFFSDRSFSRGRIVAGQILGITTIVAISPTAAFAALAFSPAHVGLLGVAPIVIGIGKLLHLSRSEGRSQTAAGGVLQVAAITIANGADNIGAYAPIFANQRPQDMMVTVAIFGALTLVWCFVAVWLVSHAALGRPVRRYGHILLPFVLIGLGSVILYASGALDLAMRFGRSSF